MNNIALCLIVKGDNAEALLLQRCLENMAQYVDGIFITRTHKKGEKPNSAVANVAREFGAQVSDYEWTNDFAAARNFNFSQVPKNFNWIMWCDADDVWRGLDKLKGVIEANKHVDGFGFWYLYDWDEFKKPVVVHRKTMIIRNDDCADWVGQLHEDLEPNRAVDIHLVEGIERLHLSNEKRSIANAQRNVEIAQGQVKLNPDDPRSYWNLANSYFAISDFENSRKMFELFLETSLSEEEIYLAHLRLGDVQKSLGNREKCIRELQAAIGIYPSLPDAYFQLAYNYYNFGNMDKAEEYCIQGMRKKPQIMKMIVYNPRDYDYNPMMLLAKVYYQKSRPDLMLPLLKGCLKIYPKDKNLKKMVKDGEKDKKMLGKALEKVQKLQKITDKDKLRAALDKLPDDLQSHPAICVIRNQNFVKTESSGKDLVIYCGNTIHQWNPELFKTKGFGGSEEAIIHLAEEWTKLGWNVTVYNNCGHKSLVYSYEIEQKEWIEDNFKGKRKFVTITYKPFWEWNYRDKQDVVILWRWAKPLDAEINAPKIFLDLHDVIPEGELNEKRMEKVTKVFVKTNFHRSLFPSVPDEKFAIVPNGLETYTDNICHCDKINKSKLVTHDGKQNIIYLCSTCKKEIIEKDPYLIINTSSPDRSMDVLPKLFKEVKKRIPKAKCAWAYGWDNFVNTYSNDSKKMAWMEQIKNEMKDAGIEDLGRLTQAEVGKLYQKASIFAYPTEFAEIDCISVKKAQGAGTIPIATDFGALAESVKYGSLIHSIKTKDNWNKPYQFHFGLEDEKRQLQFVDAVVDVLSGSDPKEQDRPKMVKWVADNFAWSKIAKRWVEQFI